MKKIISSNCKKYEKYKSEQLLIIEELKQQIRDSSGLCEKKFNYTSKRWIPLPSRVN